MVKAVKAERGVTPAKIIIYAVTLFLLGIFQVTFAARFGLFGTVPALLYGISCAAGFFEGPRGGAVVGLAAGFLADALGSVGISLSPLLYAVTVFIIGTFFEQRGNAKTNGERLALWSVALAAAAVAGIFITTVNLLLSAGRSELFRAFLHVMLPEAFCTYLWCWVMGPIYMLFYKIGK